MRLERRRWTGSRLVYRLAGRRHPRGRRPRLGPDRVRARPAPVPEHRRRGRARRSRRIPASLNGKLLALTPAAVPRAGSCAPRGRRDGPAQLAGLRLAARHRPADRQRPRADRLRRPRGLRRGRRDRAERQLRLAGGDRRRHRRRALPRAAARLSRRRSRLGRDVREPPRLALDRRLPPRRAARCAAAAARPARRGEWSASSRSCCGRFGRLRTVVEGPRGCLYVLTSNRDGRGYPTAADDRILRVRPPGARRCRLRRRGR